MNLCGCIIEWFFDKSTIVVKAQVFEKANDRRCKDGSKYVNCWNAVKTAAESVAVVHPEWIAFLLHSMEGE